jgi:hypothetical protein
VDEQELNTIVELSVEIISTPFSTVHYRVKFACKNKTRPLRRLFGSTSHSALIGYNTVHTVVRKSQCSFFLKKEQCSFFIESESSSNGSFDIPLNQPIASDAAQSQSLSIYLFIY